MCAFSRPLAYPEVSMIPSFSVQQLTTRRSCPDSPRLCNNSGSDSPKYVHYADTPCTSLELIIQLTVLTRHIGFVAPLALPPSSPPPNFHGCILNILTGEYNLIQGIVHCPMAYNSKPLPGFARQCDDLVVTPPCTCVIQISHKLR